MSEDAPPLVKLHKSPTGGKNSRRIFKTRSRTSDGRRKVSVPLPYHLRAQYVRTLEKLLAQCEKVRVYTGPISTWLYARVWLSIRLYGVAERIQDIARTPVAYVAQILSAGIALWWAFCLIVRPEMLATSIYLKALDAVIGTTPLVAIMVALGVYQIGSVLFGPSQREVQETIEQGHSPYPGTRFILTALGLWASCSIWGFVGYLTYKGGGLNLGMGMYAGLSGLQILAVLQIGRALNLEREKARQKREAEARKAAASNLSPNSPSFELNAPSLPSLGAASQSTPTSLSLPR